MALEQRAVDVMVVDSIQAFSDPMLNLSRYSATYLRTIVEDLGARAKAVGTTLILLSQINKEGALLGPKAIEHLVDTVVFFEGDRDSSRRILRVSKNRHGRSPEFAALEMSGRGLQSSQGRDDGAPSGIDRPGRIRYPAVFGSRVELVEVQALVSNGPRDAVMRPLAEGFDTGRLSLIVAIIDKALDVDLFRRHIVLQVTGGVRLSDPAADLAVAVALLSSYWDRSLPYLWTAYGELSLLGEVRCVRDSSSRMGLVRSLGFDRVVRPAVSNDGESYGDGVDDLVRALRRLGLGDCLVRAVS
jgi:DNA repair protein RadA/Sms